MSAGDEAAQEDGQGSGRWDQSWGGGSGEAQGRNPHGACGMSLLGSDRGEREQGEKWFSRGRGDGTLATA